jgi:hypothetical protein
VKTFSDMSAELSAHFGGGGIVKDYSRWGSDIREQAEQAWTHIADRVLTDYALKMLCDLDRASPIERKLFLALHAYYADELVGCPGSNCLRTNDKVSSISDFLIDKSQSPVFECGDRDFEIDIFLYLDYHIWTDNGRRIDCPFFVGIECDGHDFHERTKSQAAKDCSKTRTLKRKGLEIVRFTGTEITYRIDGCVEDIDGMFNSHVRRHKKLLAKRG